MNREQAIRGAKRAFWLSAFAAYVLGGLAAVLKILLFCAYVADSCAVSAEGLIVYGL